MKKEHQWREESPPVFKDQKNKTKTKHSGITDEVELLAWE